MNPRTRIIVTEFWEFLAFFVNSIVFLLIGTQVQFHVLGDNLTIIAITIAVMVLIRAIAIYSLSALSNLSTESKLPLSEQTVLVWGGLRGSVSIALALSVPAILKEREEIIATVFGVVLFTLLVQGLTIKPLLGSLNLLGDQPLRQQFAEAIARLAALRRVSDQITEAEQFPVIEQEFVRYQQALVKGEITRLEKEIDTLQNENPDLRAYAAEQFKLELLATEAETYAEFVRAGRLNRELAPFLQEEISE
jgi:CPA1 family monovalent cation:H+ antiporter